MQRMRRSFIKNVKECKECSVLFIKNARMLRSFEKNAKERMPNPGFKLSKV